MWCIVGVMDQLELFDLPNPCIGVCENNSKGYCLGCLRSRDERFNWHNKPVAERSRILKLLEQRRARRDAKLAQLAAEKAAQQKLDLGDAPAPDDSIPIIWDLEL
ncbi:DUF1289 domain-containing protein [Rheinheimera mangrovi]|uniref:DUF1289 domain-containing protein n=1 Tax=Rheinheimera mangrovi TaxID=2498451 RepID=UPI001E60FDFA|nr:DUF1289 domain-containing protein [Rheinheimera mangrovi]